ncbi:hypothetical protein [Actinopolyspora mortivallis]|uniref:hypothetical protein n=1 Tax=Actinopolyspora mortivallis TaxID=33906 RepID=UPI000363864B|nr:hypothetical protein [Actinopolyspora mortivallis]
MQNPRRVFAGMRATTVRDTVSFPGASQAFDETGRPVDEAGSATADGHSAGPV